MSKEPLIPYEDFVSSGVFTLHVGSSLQGFDIHKGLLGSVSEEFRKHIYNNMVEGTSGHMNLPDEREDTITRFIQWAYTGDYSVPKPVQITPTVRLDPCKTDDKDKDDKKDDKKEEMRFVVDEGKVLMAHARVYVFADRFNIQRLKNRAFEELAARFKAIRVPDTRENKLAIISLDSYAFANLPKCEPSDPLLAYLGLYTSWSLDTLREEPEFLELLESDIDFMKELFMHVKKGDKAPW